MPTGIVVRDSALPGFSARKARDGSITFRYRREGEPPIDRKLGTTKDAVTLSAARAAAEKLAAKRALGEWDSTRPKFTVDDAWPLFREHLQRKTKSERTIGSYQSALERMAPDLRATTLRALAEDPSLMAVEYDRIRTKPTLPKGKKRALGYGQAAADSTARFVRALYRYVQRRYDPSLPGNHPCVDLNLEYKEPEGELQVLRIDELPRWWAAVSKLENPLRAQAHLFSLLSGLRRNDLYEMRWQHFNDDLSFHIPKPKGGRRRAFDLILSAPMLDVLRRAKALGQERWAHRDPERAAMWVWPGSGRSGHLGGFENDHKFGVWVYLHGCRRTYASIAKAIGIEEEIIGRLLNQRTGRTITSHYVRTTVLGRALLDAQERISAAIMNGIAGKAPEEDVASDYASASIVAGFDIDA